MRVFIAGLFHETNSFSPITTSRASFERFEYHRPADGQVDERCRALNGYGGFVRAALQRGHQVHASSYASAQPSGPCSRPGYESLRDEILDDLRRSGSFDMVLLFLHGAQMADGCDDCEGDLLTRARQIVGPGTFLAALLDLHTNMSEAMLRSASALAACRHYPHIDFDDRAAHLVALGEACVRRGLRPLMHYRRVPMLGMFHTTEPRVAAVNEAALGLQQSDGMLSVSLIHGFAHTDNADLGAGVLAVSDGTRADADEQVLRLARAFFDARDETRRLRMSLDAVLAEVQAARPDPQRRPFVIADTSDNAGGGAGSDATFVLAELLRRGLQGCALALMWDPGAAQLAADAGVGARFPLRLGGKTGPQAGAPLDVQAQVLAVRPACTQTGIGFTWPMGLTVALGIGGNVVIVNSVRNQVFSPSCFSDLGVDIGAQRALVVKSSQHFRDQFAPLARAVLYCETPGTLSSNYAEVPYRKLRRPIWPIDADAAV